jgi:putative endonuclease
MSQGTRIFGQVAESEAERYLRRKGYRILERNARSCYGEIDLVAQLANVLIFVEVKARRTSVHGGAPYAVDGRKQARLVRLAAHYLSQHRLKNHVCRFDVVLCTGGSNTPIEIHHIEHAFEVPGDQLQW